MKIKSKKLNSKSIESFKIVRNIRKVSYELNLFKKMLRSDVLAAFIVLVETNIKKTK